MGMNLHKKTPSWQQASTTFWRSQSMTQATGGRLVYSPSYWASMTSEVAKLVDRLPTMYGTTPRVDEESIGLRPVVCLIDGSLMPLI